MLILAPGAMVRTGLAYYFAASVSDRSIALVIGVLAVGFALKGLLQGKRATMPAAPAQHLSVAGTSQSCGMGCNV